MSAVRTILSCVLLAGLLATAQSEPTSSGTNNSAAAEPSYARLEQIRTACIAGRRRICGRVLQITPAGLVVDSGYTSLLQPPLDHSWVTRGTATLSRPAVMLEEMAPDSVAVGVVFLTDFPKRPKARQYDYVSLIGYPAGHYDYVPAPGVKKTIRRFSGGLEHAIKLTVPSSEH